MRISDINKASKDIQKNIIVDRRSSFDTSKVFKRELTTLSEQSHNKYITELIDKITKQGEIVAKRADIKELQKYRQLITELLNENASNSFSFVKSEKFDSRGRHRVLTMLKKVNKQLDDLTTEVLKHEQDNITLLDMVDDIRGLLVDVFL
jgi:uncharacterized protein YaaR (DUF327 family)